jgi:glycosyl transferase, family 25
MLPIYIINLDKDYNRWLKVKKMLDSRNIKNYIRIDGVNGKNISEYELENATTKYCNNFCTPSMIGCAMSHIKVWEKVIENDKNSLVFEDDVILNENFIQLLTKFYQMVPKDYDIIYLGCTVGCNYNGDSNYMTNILKNIVNFKGKQHKILNEHVYIPEYPFSTHAYIISVKGAKKLLNSIKNNINSHVDQQMVETFIKEDLNVYAFEPQLVYQDKTTDNSNNTTSYPIILNKIFSNIEDSYKETFDYKLSMHFFNLHGFYINLYVIILAIASFFVGKYYSVNTWIKIFIGYNLIEIYIDCTNFYLVMQLFIITLMTSYIGSRV